MDAQARWLAAKQPQIKSVTSKTERQQSCLALHGMRRQLMKTRIIQTNPLRGVLAEFGISLSAGHTKLLKTIQCEIPRAQQADQLSGSRQPSQRDYRAGKAVCKHHSGLKADSFSNSELRSTSAATNCRN